MQRSAATVSVSMFGSEPDRNLWTIKSILENSYWASATEGVFNFQFSTGDDPLTNISGPLRFNVVRFTPDVYYDAFVLSIPGIMNNDGTFEYGGGRKGILSPDNKNILWNDRTYWEKVERVQKAKPDVLDLTNIRTQARIDSVSIGDIQDRYYFGNI